jgi:hypothetical protein
LSDLAAEARQDFGPRGIAKNAGYGECVASRKGGHVSRLCQPLKDSITLPSAKCKPLKAVLSLSPVKTYPED